jgi:hypothetical protein
MVARGDARREQVLCAAMVVFADHGYHRARLIRSGAVDPEPVVALPAVAVPVPQAAHAG